MRPARCFRPLSRGVKVNAKIHYNVKRIKGEIWVPKDKSISHRAAMLGAIAKGITEIEGFLMAQDCLSTLNCLEKMGTDIQIIQATDKTKANIKITGKGLYGLKKPSTPLFVGNSGTTIDCWPVFWQAKILKLR